MPETCFYINDKERKELFEFLTTSNAQLIPDRQYKGSSYKLVNNSEEFLEIIENETVRFFIISKEYSKQGILMKQNRFMDYPAFYVSQRYGGPYINLALYRGFADDAKVKCKCTELHHYARYINLDNYDEEFKASDELKQYFNRIVKFLKAKCKNVTIEGKKFWVSKEVIQELGISTSEKK